MAKNADCAVLADVAIAAAVEELLPLLLHSLVSNLGPIRRSVFCSTAPGMLARNYEDSGTSDVRNEQMTDIAPSHDVYAQVSSEDLTVQGLHVVPAHIRFWELGNSAPKNEDA